MSVGSNIRKYRVEEGLTQEQLSARTGIAQSNISFFERGIFNPGPRSLQKFADVLNIDVELLKK